MKTLTRNKAALLFAVTFIGSAGLSSSYAELPKPLKAEAQQSVTKGVAYLKSVQEPDGSWSRYPATTALAVTALLRHGRTELNDPAVAKAVKHILKEVKPNGAIYSDADPATALPNYNTSLCLVALALTKNPAYRPTIRKAQDYLIVSQFDEGEGVTPSDPMYGGVGYGSKPDRPDLSNLQTALEALKESDAPSSSVVWGKAIRFIQRLQDRKASNDQAWARDGKDDGGFIYDSKGRSFSTTNPKGDISGSAGQPQSYGSMTYAGLKSYIYAGVTKRDPRARAAFDWIRGHYSVTENPNMGDLSLYYYYNTMAKTLNVFGDRVLTDKQGKKRDWAADLTRELLKRQRPNGSWFNDNARFWEDQPALVTGYTLIALAYCMK